MKLLTKIFGVGVVVTFWVSILLAFCLSPYSTKRYWASYAPGDCVKSVDFNPALERWEQQEPARQVLLMVTEVGNEAYRVKGWGTRFSNKPQWYPEYESRLFRGIDNRTDYVPVPCPEEGETELPVETSVFRQTFSSACDSKGACSTVEVFRQ